MTTKHPEPDARLVELENRLTPLLDTVRDSVADRLFGPSGGAVHRFLSDAPIGVCVQLYEVWESARQSELPVELYLSRLTPENRFVLDLVSAIYSVPDPEETPPLFPDYRELEKLAGPDHDPAQVDC
jgi:hypothetical protein